MYLVKRESNLPEEIEREKCYYVKDIIKHFLNEEFTPNQSFPGCQLICDKIILNHEKQLQFYKIEPDQVIYMGSLEGYISEFCCGDKEIIVEVVVQYFVSESHFLIMKQNDNMSEVINIVARLIQITDVPGIFDINGAPLEVDKPLTHILNKNLQQKIFISWTPDYLHEGYNRYLIEKYFWYGGDLEEGWSGHFDRFFKSDEIRKCFQKFKTLLETNDIPNHHLNTILSNKLFGMSKFFFCEYYSEHFYKECEQIYKLHIINDGKFIEIYYFIRLGILIVLHELYDSYLNSEGSRPNTSSSNLMKDIIIKCLELLLSNDPKGELFIEKFITHVCNGQMRRETFENEIENYFFYDGKLKIEMIKSTKVLNVPLVSVYLFQLKKIGEIFCGIEEDLLYFVNYLEEDLKNQIEISANKTIHLKEMIRLDENQNITPIGEGAFGDIYQCKEAGSNEEFAIKIFKDPAESVREININEEIKPFNLLSKYRGLMIYEGQICVAFSLYKESLDDKIKFARRNSYCEQSVISEKKIIKWTYEILKELKELHKWGIIHRDIKPANILLDKNERATLCDYGCSKLICDKINDNIIVNTKSNSYGTMDYMSPELLKKFLCSDKLDIWSLGVVIIEMIEGKLSQDVKDKNISQENHLRFNSEKLRNFAWKCLNTDPNIRSSAEDLLQLDIFNDI